jgi:hypothetical protein
MLLKDQPPTPYALLITAHQGQEMGFDLLSKVTELALIPVLWHPCYAWSCS